MNGSDEEFGKDSITVQLIKRILEMPYDHQIALLKQLEEMPTTLLEISNREDKRKTYTNAVSFSVMGETYNGLSRDLSAGGIFIKTDDAFEVGQMVHVTIPFSNNKKRVTLPGEIVRFTDRGIGIKFLKKTVSPEDRE